MFAAGDSVISTPSAPAPEDGELIGIAVMAASFDGGACAGSAIFFFLRTTRMSNEPATKTTDASTRMMINIVSSSLFAFFLWMMTVLGRGVGVVVGTGATGAATGAGVGRGDGAGVGEKVSTETASTVISAMLKRRCALAPRRRRVKLRMFASRIAPLELVSFLPSIATKSI